ncbi:MAG: hypothetical protein Tsb009_06550 [Planctomycetaceae bacterium]
MTIKLGMEAKLYRNTGTYALPTWVEMINVKDLTLNLEAGEADVTTRGNAGWRATIAARSLLDEVAGDLEELVGRIGQRSETIGSNELIEGPNGEILKLTVHGLRGCGAVSISISATPFPESGPR